MGNQQGQLRKRRNCKGKRGQGQIVVSFLPDRPDSDQLDGGSDDATGDETGDGPAAAAEKREKRKELGPRDPPRHLNVIRNTESVAGGGGDDDDGVELEQAGIGIPSAEGEGHSSADGGDESRGGGKQGERKGGPDAPLAGRQQTCARKKKQKARQGKPGRRRRRRQHVVLV